MSKSIKKQNVQADKPNHPGVVHSNGNSKKRLQYFEGMYQSIVQHLDAGIGTLRPVFDSYNNLTDCIVDDANERLKSIFDISQTKNDISLCDIPGTQDMFLEPINKMLKEAKPSHKLVSFYAPKSAYLDLSLFALENGYIALLVSDVTKQVRAEKAFRSMQERIKQAQSMVRMGYWEMDMLKSRLFIDSHLLHLAGIDKIAEDTDPETLMQYVPEEDRKKVRTYFLRGIREGFLPKEVVRIIDENGKLHYFEHCGKIDITTDGTPHFIYGQMYDVTSVKENEMALRESEEKFRKLNENSPVSTFILQEDKLTYVNPALAKTLDIQRSGFTGELCLSDVLSEKDYPQIIADIQRLYKGEQNKYHNVYDLELKGQKRVKAEVYAAATSLYGKPAIVGMWLDVTEKQRHQRELVKAKEKAEESDRLKSAFLANMSHEIRTPLNAIVGFSKLFSDEDTSQKEREEYAEVIQSNSDHLMSLISDIIDISRLETEIVHLENSEFNINEVLRNVHNIYTNSKKLLDKDRIQLSLRLPDEDEVHISADRMRTIQVINNLMSNALKFTQRGHIEIGCVTQEDKVIVFVKDTGEGIAKENMELIFDRFRQEEDAYTRRYGGTGLGLAICKRIVERMSGDIWVESKKGEGSIFYFSLPMIKKDENAHISKSTLENGFTILVAEDNYDNYDYLTLIFREDNINLLFAPDGQKAIEMCEINDAIDIVLMDVQMPVVNGIEATKEIKNKFPDLPVIAQTAYALSGDREKFLDKGFDDYMPKPIEKEALIRVINQVMDKKK